MISSSNRAERFTTKLIMTDSLLLMLAPDLPKVTAVVGLWGWMAVSVVVAALMMFYRCSR